MNTISERLRFLISTQVRPTEEGDQVRRGNAKTFAKLEKDSGIIQSRWRDFLRGKARASEELIEAACKLWPSFALWLVCGAVSNVENRSPINQLHQKPRGEDIILQRSVDPSSINQISIPHLIKVRGETNNNLENLTSDIMDWGYFGAGACELAANVLHHFGLPSEKAIEKRIKFAREIISILNPNHAVLSAQQVTDWIERNP